jgi:hypothetical protein
MGRLEPSSLEGSMQTSQTAGCVPGGSGKLSTVTSCSYPVIPEVRCLLQAMQELSGLTQNDSAYYYCS